jgi:mannose-6-phosphate isomerase-like protein (cupin superfamily)
MTHSVEPAGAVDLGHAYATFDEVWAPRIAARVNDYDVKIAKGEGEYVWHAHDDTDEMFLVLAGRLRIELEGRDAVDLGPLHVFTVPKGVRHKPVAEPGTRVLFIEPRGTLNSGDADVSEDPSVTSTTGLPLDGS